MRTTAIKDIEPHVTLHRDPDTGIAWIEDGRSGCGHSCHANISETGSYIGMIEQRYWKKTDRTARSHGFIYNLDVRVVSDELDAIAAEHCCCVACSEARLSK